jgi:3-oxoacyl-(acyl-carrier-protein) synthase III
MAKDLIAGGTSKNVLVVGSEKISDFTDADDRATAFIFADGAGAVVIGPAEEAGIGPAVWGSDADSRDAILMNPAWTDFRSAPTKGVADLGWPNIAQQGQTVYRWAVWEMAKVAKKALEVAGIEAKDLAALVTHQANIRIIDEMVKQLQLPESVAVARDIVNTGNTSAASVPLAMHELLRTGAVKSGGYALEIGFGAGLAFAAQVVVLP